MLKGRGVGVNQQGYEIASLLDASGSVPVGGVGRRRTDNVSRPTGIRSHTHALEQAC